LAVNESAKPTVAIRDSTTTPSSGIEISVLNGTRVGWKTIIVREDFGEATGFIRVTNPSGYAEQRFLFGGASTFFFGYGGTWRIEFKNAVKTIEVTALPSETSARFTGFSILGFSSWEFLVLLLVAALLAYAYWLHSQKPRVSKKVLGSSVELAVFSGRELAKACIKDVLPEGCKATNFSQKPLKKQTVLGTLLTWEKPKLKGNWRITYERVCKGECNETKAELTASLDGKEVVEEG
jgi:hypothetical protein